jgi:BMFP domain-containing protein YqiC
MRETNDSTATPVNPEIAKGAEKIHKLITEIKLYIIESVEGVGTTEATRRLENPDLIQRKDNYDIPNWILLRSGEGGNELKAIKAELEAFRKNASEAASNEVLAKSIQQLLDTSEKEVYGEKVSWEERNFRNNMIISTLGVLTEIEKNVRMVENMVTKK